VRVETRGIGPLTPASQMGSVYCPDSETFAVFDLRGFRVALAQAVYRR